MFTTPSFAVLAAFASTAAATSWNWQFTPLASPGFCLDVAGGANADGTAVQIYSCNGSPAQIWNYSDDTNQFQIFGDKCLDVIDGNTADGALLQIWTCSGGPNQKFNIQQVTHSETNPASALHWIGAGLMNRCMDVTGGAFTNGTRVQLWDCDDSNTNQQWTYGTASGATPTTSVSASSSPTSSVSAITSTSSAAPTATHVVAPTNGQGLCLDVSGGSTANGATVQIYTCNGTPAQNWTLSNNALTVYGNKCLDVTNGANTDGTKLQIWDCTGGPNQQFQYVNGQVVQWVGQNKCLDVTNGAFAAGTPVQLWDCTYGPDQLWSIS